ncbi:MAG: DNA repair ATPase [Azonexus sp.]|jgi:MoxR-like ATPase|uniref:DNA repair ATPase n=1 Tax=Azonexus sp. TaxID=1872668 RepID=UPI00282265CD|nr:DNA repair ATPase [Azonexus sp.]MDR0777161.1 DNA repair ATPase [Azonexus sp.]
MANIPEIDATESLVAESGSYELLKKRLADRGDRLLEKTQGLNEARIAEFGRATQSLILRTRARTENNCVARDLTRIGGDLLLFGYNVFIGLRKETAVDDVFSLYRLQENAESVEELEPVPLAGTFLDDPRFVADFRELYAYYKQANLTQLRVHQHKLFAAFQIGEKLTDQRVFRWSLKNDGSLQYIDNRGEREMALPSTHDFEWTLCTRDQHVGGRHPHINILDTVFVETIHGDLTVKVENNTETGLGIYSEPVEDKNQALADAEIAYARLGTLILLKVRPYREKHDRYLVFNARTNTVTRIDAIGQSCVQLPEDHGLIFPGGYYLQSGETKAFDLPEALAATSRFKRMLRSPNGEDVLYVFYQPQGGQYMLFSYNLIERSLSPPILCHGYARFEDGRILTFQGGNPDPTRTHPMQLWQTPFFDEDHVTRAKAARGFWGRIGNPELVRGIAELTAIARAVREQVPTRVAYEGIIRQCDNALDAFFWLDAVEAGAMDAELHGIVEEARNTLDEFEKVESIRRAARQATDQAEGRQQELLSEITGTIWKRPEDFVHALDRLRGERGQLQLLLEMRYADAGRISALDAAYATESDRVGEKALAFLSQEKAFDGTRQELVRVEERLDKAATSEDIAKMLAELDASAAGLDLLTGQVGNLPGGDAVVRTRILDTISAVYAEINRLRAEARNRRRSLSATESTAEFGAQFKLFGQSLENAIELADTPEKCDDALTRLLTQLEELEGRFAEQEQFLADIAAKRETVYESILAKRQILLDARNRRARAIVDAAARILAGIPRRVAQFNELAQLHSYFASDPLIGKLRQQITSLRTLGDGVGADDLDTQFKTARDQAIRSVRDQSELVSDDGNTLRFGKHAFTISRQALDLTLVPREGVMQYHLSGTDYYAPLLPQHSAELEAFRAQWDQLLISETPDFYRAEYLAGSLLEAVIADETGDLALDWRSLQALCADKNKEPLLEKLRIWAAPRYQEGYQKGVHDADAARILAALVAMQAAAGLLSYGPDARALAMLYWHVGCRDEERSAFFRQAQAAMGIRAQYGTRASQKRLEQTLAEKIIAFAPDFDFDAGRNGLGRQAARYLVRQLASSHTDERWLIAAAADDLANDLQRKLESSGLLATWQRDLAAAAPGERWRLARDWMLAATASQPQLAIWADDAATRFALDIPRERVNADLDTSLQNLLGEHPHIHDGAIALNLHDFWRRYLHHAEVVATGFSELQAVRHRILEAEKRRLHLEQFQAKPLSSFVRNRLIDELYLPIVGDNLAKQIGATGDASRSDRMGMLLLISPPGYGKTTLMEYVADRLGMIFVRINCPALGHGITALDPTTAPNSAARQELEKLNLGLLMGNNVMLYLDDIQHTNPEFLQKFIALADGTRRIEATRNGEPTTCDLRGKRFAIVMAGNPYTESGDVFKIPDMLANRADIYNLGDVLSGREALFALSYIENSLTANPVLLPLSSRDPKDVHLLVRMAEGESIAGSEFAHGYSTAELNELVALMQRLFRARDLLLKVNLAYIESAAQQDAYRVEPPFRLQGSYRNMTKLAARITPLMDEGELDALLRDHYRGEAQTLTTGAEENLLKLAELLGSLNKEEQARWREIREEFVRRKKLGGDDADGSQRIANTLLDISRAVDELRTQSETTQILKKGLASLIKTVGSLEPRIDVQPNIAIAAPDTKAFGESLQEMKQLYNNVLSPLISANYHKLKLDHSIWENVKRMNETLKRLEKVLPDN